jgi:hypothetical protein
MRILLIQFALCMLLAPIAFASEEHGAEGKLPASVLAHDPEQGFRIAPAAISRLGIQFKKLQGVGPWEIPSSALIKVKRALGVYREVDGFLTLVVVEQVGPGKETVRIASEDLQAGDTVAVGGASFLRVIDLDLSGGGGDSCGG